MNDKYVLGIVRELCEELKQNNIKYCHWKSNNAIDRSASAENDLDLLVDRLDSKIFIQILNHLGFKEFFPPADIEVPGIRNYYGIDNSSKKIVHVHAHFQLVVGHDLSKNYHIPIEPAFLDSSTQGDLFRLPSPEFELIVFVIRMMIKHFTLDMIFGNYGNLSKNEKVELEYLIGKVNLIEVHRILSLYLPFLDEKTFDRCTTILQSKRSLYFRILTSQKLLNQLKTCTRRPMRVDIALKTWKSLTHRLEWHLFRKKFAKVNANGGAIVAIVGGDGSGKTTVINSLYEWLSPHFSTSCFHMGKPTWSWSTIFIRGIVKIGTLFGVLKVQEEPSSNKPDIKNNHGPDYVRAIRSLCIANDRYLTYLKARRFSSFGGIALCDRFPIPEILTMDGPQIQLLLGDYKKNRFLNWMSRKEKMLYQQIMKPEIMIVLQLDPEIAVKRKVTENSDYVRARSNLIWQADWSFTVSTMVDANKPKEELLSDIKALIWTNI